MKLAKDWKLPPPPPEERRVWSPVVRLKKSGTVPWGYKVDPEDDAILIPIPEELELLEIAKKLLKEYSLRNVAAWLTDQSGRYISHEGLSKRVKLESKRRREAASYRRYQELAEEAARKAKEIEERLVGGAPEEYISVPYNGINLDYDKR